MNKRELRGLLVIAALLFLLLRDALYTYWNKGGRIPHNLKEIVLTGILLWISTLFINQKRDDDWAGLL